MKIKLLVSLCAVSLLLSSCGGGGAAAPAATSAPAATTAATEPPAATVAPAATEAPAATAPPAATEAPAATEPPSATEAPAPTEAPSAAAPVVYKISESESVASYSVEETFINQNNKLVTAVGKTSKINGEITLDTTDPSKSTVGEITVDISLLASDSGRRDNAIRGRWLESTKFPLATFKATAIEGLPTSYQPGQEITFKITGDMTVRETTTPVTWEVKAKFDGNKLIGEATTAIKMSQFGFEAPNILGILRAEEDAALTFTFVALPVQ